MTLQEVIRRRSNKKAMHGGEYAGGTLWSKQDMEDLVILMKQGFPNYKVGALMGRSDLACEKMYRDLRRLDVLKSNDPNATLRSIQKET